MLCFFFIYILCFLMFSLKCRWGSGTNNTPSTESTTDEKLHLKNRMS